MEFETFLKALELIAVKIYPDLEPPAGLRLLIEAKLLPLTEKREIQTNSYGMHHITLLKEILGDEEVVSILGILHENIQSYYNHYSDSKGLMNFKQFLEFYKNFEIFPHLISHSKLAKYFFALASLRVNILLNKYRTLKIHLSPENEIIWHQNRQKQS